MSLPQTALPCSSHLISAPCTDFTIYIFCTITLLFALSKYTHTQAQYHYRALPILTSTRTLYIFLLSPHQQHNITFHFSLFTFLLDTDTVKIIALCTIG